MFNRTRSNPLGKCRTALTMGMVVVASFGAAATASATTGPGYLLQHPGYKVTHKVAKPFIGVWKYDPKGDSRNMISSSMFANFSQRPENFLVGQVQVVAYDKSGQEGDWVGTMYDWHWTGKEMQMELVGFGGSPRLGYMTLKTAGRNHLRGTVVTTGDRSRYTVVFTKTKLKPQPVSG